MNTISLKRRGNIVAACLILLTASLASVSLAADTAKSAPLNIGDPAPVLRPAKWLKGSPIPAFQKGHVYLVEFWATWCGPCKANIPHLTELAKKYRGKVEVIGVDIWESSDPTIQTLPKVEAFVKSQGAHMDYHVAADGPDARIANTWMKAAGEGGIPTAFLIGKDGRIAWIGNPATGLASVLPQVIEGTFDRVAARTLRERQNGPMAAIQKALADKDYTGAIRLIDAQVAKNPESERGYGLFRFMALAHADVPEFQKRARALLTQSDGEISMYQMLCSIPASDKELSPDVYRFGRSLVDEALLKKDREYLFHAMGAEMDARLGDKAGAVRSQTAAVKAAETDSHCPAEFLEFLRKNLEKFQSAAGV